MSETEILRLAANTKEAAAEAAKAFERLRDLLRRKLPDGCEILHIGATAIQDCMTKGDLDILVRVPADAFAAADACLAELFERNTGSARTSTFSAFEDAGAAPPLGVQLCSIGGDFDEFHRFVEYLQQSPKLVSDYNALKRRFNGQPMDAYRQAKGEFVARVLESGDRGEA